MIRPCLAVKANDLLRAIIISDGSPGADCALLGGGAFDSLGLKA